MNKKAQRYETVAKETDVLSASSVGLIVLIYDRIIRLLSEYKECLEQGKDPHALVDKLIDLISIGLVGALDYKKGGDIAQNLRSVYTATLYQILQIRISRDPSALSPIIDIVMNLRDAWVKLENPDSFSTKLAMNAGGEVVAST